MDETYGAVCLMCGRDLGHIVQGKYLARPEGPRLERHGHQLRCGHCHGGVLLEPDPTLQPPRDWIAELKRAEAASGRSRRPYRRRAG
jgi:hypothetical protein